MQLSAWWFFNYGIIITFRLKRKYAELKAYYLYSI